MRRGQVVRHLLAYLAKVWVPFSISFVVLLLVAGLTAAKAWIIQPVVDAFIGGRTTQGDLLLLCALVAGIFISQAGLNWLYSMIAGVASGRFVRAIRADLFGRLSRQGLGYFVDRPSADLASRVVNDVAAFENAAVGSVQNLMRDLATVGMLLLVLLFKEWRLALSCLAIVAVVGSVLRRRSRQIESIGRRVQEMVSGLNRQLSELIGGIELILGFGLGRDSRDRFEEVNLRHYGTKLSAVRATASSVTLVLVIVGLGLSGILFVTGRALLAGTISPGDFGTFLAAIYLMQAPALNIASSVANLSRGMAAAGRALELLQHEPEILDPESPRPLPAGDLEIELDEVSFRYEEKATVVEGLSFEIRPGELVVMVGDSGSGKSTVARLLMRFYDPLEGEVRIGGIPIREIARADLYRYLSYVSQEVFLFDGSIEFNLRVGRPAAADGEVAEAVRIACLEDFLAELPEGLATDVGERGVRLSGGQRQRIAIARAILTEARALVLDEATSALDMELEQRILQNLVDSRRSRAIFAVTHRLSLAEIADRVLVLKEGRLVEEGRAAELSARDGEFARLRRAAQASLVRDAAPAGSPLGFGGAGRTP